MPRPSPTLHIPAPCAESWAAMTPAGAGRHCAACQKTVVDFTQKTDAEILAYLAGAAGMPCGRFRATQLGRPVQSPPTASRWRAWLGALLAVGSASALLAPKTAAQATLRGTAGPVPMATSSTQQSPSAPGSQKTSATAPANTDSANAQPIAAQLPTNLTEIRGIVLDAQQCDPLPGVMVLVKGTAIGTTTDIRGEFRLTPPPTAEPMQLVIRSVGYSPQERTVTYKTATSRMEIALESEVMGLLITPYYPPAPWHPRRLYQWGRYWLTRPFRR